MLRHRSRQSMSDSIGNGRANGEFGVELDQSGHRSATLPGQRFAFFGESLCPDAGRGGGVSLKPSVKCAKDLRPAGPVRVIFLSADWRRVGGEFVRLFLSWVIGESRSNLIASHGWLRRSFV